MRCGGSSRGEGTSSRRGDDVFRHEVRERQEPAPNACSYDFSKSALAGPE
jgi:hypothetical protein